MRHNPSKVEIHGDMYAVITGEIGAAPSRLAMAWALYLHLFDQLSNGQRNLELVWLLGVEEETGLPGCPPRLWRLIAQRIAAEWSTEATDTTEPAALTAGS